MKKMVVLGAGISGIGTAMLGSKQGFEVFVSDAGLIKPQFKNALLEMGVAWEEGGHSEERIMGAQLVIKSPGIPDQAIIIRKLVKNGVPVVSEIEFAFWYTKAKTIAITGSNGKTTTTMLTYHLLREAGVNCNMAGNIGVSFAEQVALEEPAFFVLEVSSFQLDGIKHFKPDIAILTNITPDHLDRYQYNFKKYIESKFRITMNQSSDDYFIYDADDPVISTELDAIEIRSKKVPFSLTRELDYGLFYANDAIQIHLDQSPYSIPTEILGLEGKHNIKNTMAALAAANLIKIRKETLKSSLANFQGAPHRMQKIKKVDQIQFIDDAKGTNVNSVYYALDSIAGNVIWIAGGQDKGNNYTELLPLVREKVTAIICLGVDNNKIVEVFGPVVEILVETHTMADAVKMAKEFAEPGDTVLLSPACASFDLFTDYKDKGTQFQEMVNKL